MGAGGGRRPVGRGVRRLPPPPRVGGDTVRTAHTSACRAARGRGSSPRPAPLPHGSVEGVHGGDRDGGGGGGTDALHAPMGGGGGRGTWPRHTSRQSDSGNRRTAVLCTHAAPGQPQPLDTPSPSGSKRRPPPTQERHGPWAWGGGGRDALEGGAYPPPLQRALPMPSHCLFDAK